jgi:hypothetical protein
MYKAKKSKSGSRNIFSPGTVGACTGSIQGYLRVLCRFAEGGSTDTDVGGPFFGCRGRLELGTRLGALCTSSAGRRPCRGVCEPDCDIAVSRIRATMDSALARPTSFANSRGFGLREYICGNGDFIGSEYLLRPNASWLVK